MLGKKLNAHALYFSVLLSVIIAIIITSLFLVAHYYSLLTADINNKDHLLHNLLSVEALALSSHSKELETSLFDNSNNNVGFYKASWGIFEAIVCWATVKEDTLVSSFLLGRVEDKQLALSVIDQGHALKVSGTSQINGNVYLPKAGVKSFLVNNIPYSEKTFLTGENLPGKFNLTSYQNKVLKYWREVEELKNTAQPIDEITNEIFNPFSNQAFLLTQLSSSDRLKGKLIVSSSNGLTIPSSAELEDIIIIAPHVIVSSGFKGSIQVFATDSIVVNSNSSLTYPSSLNLLVKQKGNPRIELKKDAYMQGVITAFNEDNSLSTSLVKLNSSAVLEGEIVSNGYVHLEGKVWGSVFCQSLIYNSGSIFYDNAIYNGVINRSKRHDAFLGLCGEEKRIIKKLN